MSVAKLRGINMPAIDPVTAGINFASKLVTHIFGDPETAEERQRAADAQHKILELSQNGELQKMATAAGVVTAEAKSEHWITSAWRPITMLSFVGMLWCRVLGLAADDLSEAVMIELIGLIKLGLGGYVIGRTVEKTGAVEATINAVKHVVKKER